MTDNQIRHSRQRELYSLLGDLPARDREIRVLQREVASGDQYQIEKLLLDLNGIEDVPAYFVKPVGATGRLPVVLFNHWHGGQYELGKQELIRGHREANLPTYAEELTRLGFAALCIDQWAFGQRSTRSEGDIFKDMLWHGRVMWGMMVYDGLRAVDYLAGREDVDAGRIATLGMSMGSTMSWWLAALDERIERCVDICGLTDYQSLLDGGYLRGHGIYYYVPGLLKHFTASQINELIVPRAHLALEGNCDPLTPARGLDRIDAELRQAYAAAKVPERWEIFREDVGHVETPAMRAKALEFLKKRF